MALRCFPSITITAPNAATLPASQVYIDIKRAWPSPLSLKTANPASRKFDHAKEQADWQTDIESHCSFFQKGPAVGHGPDVSHLITWG